MKKINILLVFVGIFIGKLFSQEALLNDPQREIYLYRKNFPINPPLISIDNTLTALTTIYCRDGSYNYSICSICSSTTTVTINNSGSSSSGWNFFRS